MPDYNINPGPQGGVGAFGLVPGPVGLPQPAQDLTAQIPDLAGINKSASQNIYSQMLGRLSPGMMAQLQDAAATQANAGGMPGTNKLAGSLYGNLDLLKNILSSEQLQQMGLQNYNQFIPTVSKTQTVSPETQIALAERNATMGAAPNPQAAASYAESLFNRYMQRFGGPAGGTGGYRIVGSLPGQPQQSTPRGQEPGIVVGYGQRAMDTQPGGASFGLGTGLNPLLAGGLAAQQQATEDFWDSLGLGIGGSGRTGIYTSPSDIPAEATTPGVNITQPTYGSPWDVPANTPSSPYTEEMSRQYLETLPWE